MARLPFFSKKLYFLDKLLFVNLTSLQSSSFQTNELPDPSEDEGP